MIKPEQLKNRCQKRPDETLQEFEVGVVRLVRGSYPEIRDNYYEILAFENFLDGIRDTDIQLAVRLTNLESLNDAQARALELEAAKSSLEIPIRDYVAEETGEVMKEVKKSCPMFAITERTFAGTVDEQDITEAVVLSCRLNIHKLSTKSKMSPLKRQGIQSSII